MDAFDCEGLDSRGFEGFVSVDALRRPSTVIPAAPGIYVVCRESLATPEFLRRSVGGWFKNRDPSVSNHRLTTEWVDDCSILYIGRAASLRNRLEQLARFAAGERVGHWGGRLLWQLTDHADFVVAWRLAEDPVTAEAVMIDEFCEHYGALPFANLQRPRAGLAA